MNLFINGSNREKNCYNILKDIMTTNDELISLSHKEIKYCLGCNSCVNKLKNYCVIDDFMTENIYQKLRDANKIIIVSPIYMSGISGLLKNVIDRLNPFSIHGYFKNKKVYLILTGQLDQDENKEDIQKIIDYFKCISEYMNFRFIFLDYFTSGDVCKIDDVKVSQQNYLELINKIKEILKEE